MYNALSPSFRKLILAAALATGLALPRQADAGGSAELLIGQNSTILNLKVTVEVAPNLHFFTKQVPSVNYDNKVSHYGLISLGYQVLNGLNVVAQAQARTGAGAAPRAGLEYSKSSGDFKFYGLAASTIQENLQVELQANVGYKPKLTDDLRLAAGLEAVAFLSPEKGYDYSTYKLRAGLAAGSLEFGPAVNLKSADGKLYYNAGGTVKVNF